MCSSVLKILIPLLFRVYYAQGVTLPKVEEKPLLLDSYLPATMQILAYLSEMMKYDLRPSTESPYGSTIAPAISSTPHHGPAIYAPQKQPGHNTYFKSLKNDNSYREYADLLKRPSGLNYFDRYKQAMGEINQDSSTATINVVDNNDDILERVATYFGRNFIDTFKLTKNIEKDIPNELEQSQEFLKKYDDSNFRAELLKQKQVPPTKAYVTLLSLYDLLNKESKRLGLNVYNGYTEKILKELVDTSTNTSANQLRIVLKKALDRQDISKRDIVNKMKQLINDLQKSDSYINLALRYIPALAFVM